MKVEFDTSFNTKISFHAITSTNLHRQWLFIQIYSCGCGVRAYCVRPMGPGSNPCTNQLFVFVFARIIHPKLNKSQVSRAKSLVITIGRLAMSASAKIPP